MLYKLSFYYRPSTPEIFCLNSEHMGFNEYYGDIEPYGVVNSFRTDLDGLSGLYRVDAVVKETYHRDYWGEVDVDEDVLWSNITKAGSWSDLRKTWTNICIDEGILPEYHTERLITCLEGDNNDK